MSAMPRPLCLYHKNCLDGNGAAAVVNRKEPDCEFLSMQYGMTPPTVLDRRVYVVDFGLPVEHMRALKAQASEVIWIDHHATQAAVHKQLGWGTLDLNECGSSLTWKVLFGDREPPPVIPYIKDKDLWQWKLPDSRAIAAGLSATFSGDRFQGILEADLAQMAEIGRPLLAATAERVQKAVQQGIAVEAPYGLAGVRALVVACNQDQNEVGDHICLPTSAGGLGYDLAILVYRKGNGRWVHSLRANDGGRVDCAAIGEARGGGGHRTSACYLNKTRFLASADCPAAQRQPS
jgi:hypothetical protein